MPETLLPIRPGTLPPGICYIDEQARLVDFSANQFAVLEAGAVYNYGASKPAIAFQGFPWLNSTDMQWYKFEGQWLRPHPWAPGRHLWEEFAVESDVWSFDGGDGVNPATTAPTTNAGAMWEVDHAYDGRSPMSPGVVPGAVPAITLTPATNLGDGSLALLVANLPSHKHTPETSEADGFFGRAVAGAPATYNVLGGGDTISMSDTAATGGDKPFSLIHPIRAMFCIKRTGRVNYVIP